jgi:hypothetical protein
LYNERKINIVRQEHQVKIVIFTRSILKAEIIYVKNPLWHHLTLILLIWRIGRALNSIPIYIQHDATLHSLLISGTALLVSGGISTHHQERIQLYLQHMVFVTPLLLSDAIEEELGPV